MLSGSMFVNKPNKQLKSEKAGDWINTKCNKHNYFVCEKTQSYDLLKLVKVVMKLEEEQKISSLEVNNLKNENTILKKDIKSLKDLVKNTTILEVKKSLSDLKSETDELNKITTQLKAKDTFLEKLARSGK